jgi:SMC interacting uncharacterized protein involved in chromosome segregation
MLERRLMDVSGRMKRLRRELAVADEQLRFLRDEADDSRLRALVSETSETPLADAEARQAVRHADAMERRRDELARTIGELEREVDALLDRMAHNLDRS